MLLLSASAAGFTHAAFGQEIPGVVRSEVGAVGVADSAPRSRGRGWSTEASVTALATLTNNANYGSTDVRAGDLVLEVIPALRLSREGRRLRVNGYLAFDALAYVDGTQVSRVLPKANVAANVEAIENLFFVDASIFADQLIVNPYVPGSGFASTNNLYTSTQARLAPYFKGNIGRNVNWQLRSDNSYTWTSQTDTPLDNTYYVRNLAEIVRDPTPVGVTLRLVNDVTRFKDQVQQDQTLDTALALVDYAFSPQLAVGLRGGYEKTNYTGDETAGPIYGVTARWQPSPVTSLVGYWEDRFFGPSYQVEFSHRQRRLASSFSSYRTITTYPQVLFQLPSTSSVSGLLDAILVARFPDPVERATQVRDLVVRQGLPQSLPAGTYIYNQSANILTGASINWALTGVRNILAFGLFYLKTELLPDARVPPSFLVFNNSVQQGGGLTLSHRVSRVVTANGAVSTQYTRGFDANEGLNARENIASLQFNWQVSPRSTAFVGARYQVQTTTSAALAATESSEAAVFTGLFHRM